MVSRPLRGVIAAIATPVTPDGSPDHVRFIKLAQHLLIEGCDGLNVLGTTGEATSFTVDQRLSLMTAVADAGLPLGRLMVGTGAAAVGDATRLTRHADELGFAGALLLPPFYYKGVGRDGVFRYVEAVVTAAPAIPIYLYNFPALSGVAYSLELVARLIEAFPTHLAGLKDSSGDMLYARSIAGLSSSFAVFPSNEAALIEARSGIFAGCISATANLNSDLCAQAYHAGDAVALARAVAIRHIFESIPLVPGVKAVLSHRIGDPELARTMPPLVPLTDDATRGLALRYDLLRRSSASLPTEYDDSGQRCNERLRG